MAFERRREKSGGRTMKRTAALILTAFMASPAFAADAPSSLFFTADENKTIAAIVAKEAHPSDASVLRLNAIFYYGPGDWVFWLGKRRWMPGSDEPHLHVMSVGPDEVRLEWQGGKDAPREITLRPHQTLELATGSVIER
jgi:hypothetical protein